MRQRITPSQLAELTPSQQEKLREWWKPQDGDLYIDEHDVILIADSITPTLPTIPDNYSTPLLSIGQCIELLGARLRKIDYDGFVRNYYVQTNKGTNGKPELIDALFEAVKSIL